MLWIDGQALQTASRQRGIGRYVREFIRAVSVGGFGLDVAISFNAAMSDEAISARTDVQQWIDPSNIHVWQGIAEAGEADIGYSERRRLSEVALSHHVACLKPDVALSASPFEGAQDVAVPLCPMKPSSSMIASIFYDAIPHRFSDEYLTSPARRAFYYRRLDFYKAFDLNLCISEYSRSEAIELSGNVSSVNISAGVSSDFIHYLQNEGRLKSDNRYSMAVLNVGSLDWRKNAGVLIEAIDKLPDILKSQVKLILVGDYLPAQVDRLKARWDELGLPSSNFISLGHVSDRELVSLYRSVGLVVQPSLLEGFGLTALEAMSCGTPVIGSSAGALPEILEDPDLLFDPTKPNEIADRIAQVFLKPELASQRVSKGFDRSRRFSWANSAELAVKALLETVRQKGRSTVSTDRVSARQRAAEALTDLFIPLDVIAGAMARAEPEPDAAKRLVIDATSTTRVDHGTGIQRVTKQIVRQLLKEEPRPTVIYCDSADGFVGVKMTPDGNGFEKSADKVRLLGGDTVFMLDSSWEFYREHQPFLLAARQRGAQVISCLYDLVPIRQVAMCHPGIPPVFVEWLKSALSCSTGFVCISRAVADELFSMLEGISFPRSLKIGFWHLGADFSPSLPVAARPVGQPKKRLSFLMVGTIEPRKGHRIAIDAFEQLWREGLDVDLVVVGKSGWESKQLIDRLRAHPTAGKRLKWHASADDDELLRLYSECDALIAASYVEGFGLPLVEALHFGKPIIASDIPVFREVTNRGPSVTFFEVGSSTSLAAAVRKFMSSFEHQQGKVADAISWSSWSESAAELRTILANETWYREYRPALSKPYASVFDYGKTEMTGPLGIEGQRCRLELVEGPIDSEEKFRYILRVTNLSAEVWSSRSLKDTAWGVFLSYRIFGDDGAVVEVKPPRFGIPFVMIPGDSHYMAVEIPRNAIMQGTTLAVEMFQENASWWGNPLRIDLSVR